jgi:hypothetical protein
MAAVPPDELPLGEDAIDLVSEEPVEPAVPDSLGSEAPVEAYLDDEPAADDTEPESEHPPVDESEDDPRADEPAGRPAKRKGRASVPSWDEIMFGGGKHD